MPDTRVLIVDDSALMRKMLSDALGAVPGLSVVGTAPNGSIALAKAADLNPDVITLDMDMPGMDGLEVLERIMASDNPRPVIMFSSLTKRGAEVTLQALEGGAADYATKPAGLHSAAGGASFEECVADLARKIRAVARFKPARRPARAAAPEVTGPVPASPTSRPASSGSLDPERFVALGISTGGPPALTALLPSLPPDLPPFAIVQHMPVSFIPSFAERLNKVSSLDVRVAEDGVVVRPGQCLVAPGDRHLEIFRSGGVYRARVFEGAKVGGHMPAADVLLKSVAAAAGEKAVGVLMTGMGRDGADGLAAIRKGGGRTIAQNEKTCVVYGMPKAAVEEGNAERVLPLEEIARGIVEFCRR